MPKEAPAARAALLAACAVAFLAACAPEDQRSAAAHAISTIAFHADPGSPDYGAVEVGPLDPDVLNRWSDRQPTLEQGQQVLAVYTGAEVPAQDALPMLGRYSVDGDVLRFTPRFPPVPGQPYIARFYDAKGQAVLDTVLLIPRKPAVAATYVEQIYPSGDNVPMNLLRMYVHFSAPMRMGESSHHVRLLDDQGNRVEDVFLVVAQQELWDPERRRLTLLFDPGRIKRDLRPHEELGLPLRAGGRYRLVIDSAWRDAQGNPLVRSFEKRFTVGPPDRGLPQPKDWRVQPPPANTLSALTLDFPEPFDRALLERLLVVKRTDGPAISGSIEITDGERRWSFTPDARWQAGSYVVEVGTELEDLAGNNLRDLFDVDRKAAQTPGVSGARTRIPFVVVSRGAR